MVLSVKHTDWNRSWAWHATFYNKGRAEDIIAVTEGALFEVLFLDK